MTNEEAINICKREQYCASHSVCSHEECPWNENCPYDAPFDSEIQEAFQMAIEALSLPQWIPCSERLPTDEDYDETFTVTIQCEHYDGWDDYVTGYADWTPHGWDIQSYYLGQIKVIAWMPLPEPWKGEANASD